MGGLQRKQLLMKVARFFDCSVDLARDSTLDLVQVILGVEQLLSQRRSFVQQWCRWWLPTTTTRPIAGFGRWITHKAHAEAVRVTEMAVTRLVLHLVRGV